MISSIIGIITGFANGLFGSGGGSIVVPAMERFLKISTHKAHATAIAIILPLSILSAFIYVRGDVAPISTIIYVSIGGVLGGAVGAKLLCKISSKWLHRIFGLVIVTASIRMIL